MGITFGKVPHLNLRFAIALLCSVAAVINAARAATAATDAAAAETVPVSTLDEVIVTGSRQSGLKASDSPAPIQVVSIEELKAASGGGDLLSTLSQIVP